VHTCNPSLRWGGWWIQATWAKKKEEEEEKIGQILPQLEKKLGVVVYTCHPSNSEKYKIGRLRSGPAWAKARLYL
jgi:hypothetical protein